MGGYVALASAFFGQAPWKVAAAGCLLGAAAALKLTNLIFALVPALPMVVGCVAGVRNRAKILLIFATSVIAAMLLIGGPWAWALWKEFRNPFFPMFDGFFNPQPNLGAAATAQRDMSFAARLINTLNSIRDPRFLPSSLTEALLKPVDIATAGRKIHTETMAADARYLAILIVPFLCLIHALRSRKYPIPQPQNSNTSVRALTYLALSLSVSWTLWIWISGNSRYALPLACITSVVFAAGVQFSLSFKPIAVRWVLGAALAVQVLFLATAADFRWGAQPWDGPWIQTKVPIELQKKPFLYLLLDSQSQSLLFPHLAAGSAFAGLAPDVDPKSQYGQRLSHLIAEHSPNVRMLTLVKALAPDGQPVAPAVSTFDFPLRRFGLQVDTSDCAYLQYRGDPGVINYSKSQDGARDQVHVYTCRVIRGSGIDGGELAGKRLADEVLNRVEDACDGLLPSQSNSSVRSGSIWRRNYADTAAWVNDDGWVRFTDLFRGGGDIAGLGSAEEWLTSPPKLRCWRSKGRYYVERVDH